MIPTDVIIELVGVKMGGFIENPEAIFKVGIISSQTKKVIGAVSNQVFISKKALKHKRLIVKIRSFLHFL